MTQHRVLSPGYRWRGVTHIADRWPLAPPASNWVDWAGEGPPAEGQASSWGGGAHSCSSLKGFTCWGRLARGEHGAIQAGVQGTHAGRPEGPWRGCRQCSQEEESICPPQLLLGHLGPSLVPILPSTGGDSFSAAKLSFRVPASEQEEGAGLHLAQSRTVAWHPLAIAWRGMRRCPLPSETSRYPAPLGFSAPDHWGTSMRPLPPGLEQAPSSGETEAVRSQGSGDLKLPQTPPPAV